MFDKLATTDVGVDVAGLIPACLIPLEASSLVTEAAEAEAGCGCFASLDRKNV